MNYEFLFNLTLDDGIDDKAADFFIEREVECYIRENKPLSERVYSMLDDLVDECKQSEVYKIGYDSLDSELISKDMLETMSARQFLQHILFVINTDNLDKVTVGIRVMMPIFKEKYDLENKSDEKICS
ncbi:MAG: hypothetical protein E7262_09580 [Lachnospiraceae bacterium]|nr:hypothetical protein [Lachnospiraceae bacterium]